MVKHGTLLCPKREMRQSIWHVPKSKLGLQIWDGGNTCFLSSCFSIRKHSIIYGKYQQSYRWVSLGFTNFISFVVNILNSNHVDQPQLVRKFPCAIQWEITEEISHGCQHFKFVCCQHLKFN